MVSKSGPATAAADTDVSYSVSILNVGPDDAALVNLEDIMPAGMTFVSATQNSGPTFTCTDPGVGNNGTITCSVSALVNGASADFTFVLHIPPGTPAGSSFTNHAVSSSETLDPGDKNNDAVATTFVPAVAADLAVTKTAPAYVGPGNNLVYTITLVNAGPDAATTVALDDTLPGPLTFVSLSQSGSPTFSCTTPSAGAGGTVSCSVATMPSGSSVTFTLTTNVPAGTASGTSLDNTATVKSDADPADENNAATAGTTVSSADLSAAKTAPATATAGTDIAYGLTISNAGPDAALSAVLQDVMPANTTFVSLVQNTGPTAAGCVTPGTGGNGAITCTWNALASGATATFTLTLHLAPTIPNGTVVSNTASVSAQAYDPNGANDAATASTTVANSADVAITKTAPATINAGANVSYTVSVTNAGPDVAANVAWTDTLPAGTTFVSLTQNTGPTFACTTGATINCTRATLASGASASFTLVAQVAASTASGTSLGNTATINASSPDSNTGNNTSTATTSVTLSSDLGVTKTAPPSASPGTQVTYQIGASNAGPSDATSVVLTDTLPANVTFVSLVQNTGPSFSCSTPTPGTNGPISCSLAAFASGGSATFTLVATLNAAAVTGTSFVNSAQIGGSAADPNTANNTVSATTIVGTAPDVAVTKVGPITVVAGQTVTYTLVVNNVGTADAPNVTLNDLLPPPLTFVSLTQSAGPTFACTVPAVGTNGAPQCTLANLPTGASATFTLVATVPASTADATPITNVATVSTSATDPNPVNDSATALTTVSNPADLVLTKSGPATVVAGLDVVYTLTLANNGGAAAATVNLTDVLPAPTTFASLVQNAGPTFACTTPAAGTNGTVSCDLASLPAGSTATFTLTLHTTLGATGTLSNTATATTASAEASTTNNTGSTNAQFGVATGIPALDARMLALLAALLALAALPALRRRRD